VVSLFPLNVNNVNNIIEKKNNLEIKFIIHIHYVCYMLRLHIFQNFENECQTIQSFIAYLLYHKIVFIKIKFMFDEKTKFYEIYYKTFIFRILIIEISNNIHFIRYMQ